MVERLIWLNKSCTPLKGQELREFRKSEYEEIRFGLAETLASMEGVRITGTNEYCWTLELDSLNLVEKLRQIPYIRSVTENRRVVLFSKEES